MAPEKTISQATTSAELTLVMDVILMRRRRIVDKGPPFVRPNVILIRIRPRINAKKSTLTDRSVGFRDRKCRERIYGAETAHIRKKES